MFGNIYTCIHTQSNIFLKSKNGEYEYSQILLFIWHFDNDAILIFASLLFMSTMQSKIFIGQLSGSI